MTLPGAILLLSTARGAILRVVTALIRQFGLCNAPISEVSVTTPPSTISWATTQAVPSHTFKIGSPATAGVYPQSVAPPSGGLGAEVCR